jgi:hypothetical protein
MQKFWVVCLTLMAVAAGSFFAYAQPFGKSLSGWYDFYSGSPGELGEPTAKDTKLHITVTGALAARMFRELGPRAQIKASCPEGSVSRERDQLSCTREASGQTTCDFGFDMRSGKSIGGMTSC